MCAYSSRYGDSNAYEVGRPPAGPKSINSIELVERSDRRLHRRWQSPRAPALRADVASACLGPAGPPAMSAGVGPPSVPPSSPGASMSQIIAQTTRAGRERRFIVVPRRIRPAEPPKPAVAAVGAAPGAQRSIQDAPSLRRTAPRRIATTAALALLVMVMSVAAAAARPLPGEHRDRRHQPADETGAVARQWYDITDQTITAAAFPEPATQSRTWSVSWLAAARAVRRRARPRLSGGRLRPGAARHARRSRPRPADRAGR